MTPSLLFAAVMYESPLTYLAAGVAASKGRKEYENDDDDVNSKQNCPDSILTVVYSKFERRRVTFLANLVRRISDNKTGRDETPPEIHGGVHTSAWNTEEVI